LADNVYFAAALQVAPQYMHTPTFERIALTSADIDAVNNILKTGSRPENLVMSPAYIFIGAPTSDAPASRRHTVDLCRTTHIGRLLTAEQLHKAFPLMVAFKKQHGAGYADHGKSPKGGD
jgi:hypothetical protein